MQSPALAVELPRQSFRERGCGSNAEESAVFGIFGPPGPFRSDGDNDFEADEAVVQQHPSARAHARGDGSRLRQTRDRSQRASSPADIDSMVSGTTFVQSGAVPASGLSFVGIASNNVPPAETFLGGSTRKFDHEDALDGAACVQRPAVKACASFDDGRLRGSCRLGQHLPSLRGTSQHADLPRASASDGEHARVDDEAAPQQHPAVKARASFDDNRTRLLRHRDQCSDKDGHHDPAVASNPAALTSVQSVVQPNVTSPSAAVLPSSSVLTCAEGAAAASAVVDGVVCQDRQGTT